MDKIFVEYDKDPGYHAILQNIICDRYADRSAAFCAIDEAFEAGTINQIEARKLEYFETRRHP